MRAKTAWGPNPSDPDSRLHLSTASPLPSLPEGTVDTDDAPSPSPDCSLTDDSPGSSRQQRIPNGADTDCRRGHSPKHQRLENGHHFSSSSRHGENVRGESSASSSLARRHGRGGREGDRGSHGVSGTSPSGHVGGTNLYHHAETLGVIQEKEEDRRAKEQGQADHHHHHHHHRRRPPGPDGDEQGDHTLLSDPRSGVVISITPFPASETRGPAGQNKATSSSSFSRSPSSASRPHSRANGGPHSASTASTTTTARPSSSSRPHSRLEEEHPPHSKASNHSRGPPAFLRAHNGAVGDNDNTPRSTSSAISPATSRPSSSRPHSRQGHHSSRPGSSRPSSRHSFGGRVHASSRQHESLGYREGGERRRLGKSGKEWDESSGSRSHPGSGGVDSHSLSSHPRSQKRTVRRRPSTAPPTIRVRQKKDYMEKEEAYQAELRERQGAANAKYVIPPEHHPHFSDEAKQKHEEIILRILDDFDLDETKDKYRNSNACELRREGKSIADFKFRSELMRLMGSEVIRISDNTWTTRFQDSLMEDYGRKLDAKEQKLAEAETERIHRLRLEGIITGSTCENSEDVVKKAFTPIRLKTSKFTIRPFRRRSSGDKEPEPIFRDEKINMRERAVSARRTARIYQAPVKTILQADQGKEVDLESHPVHLEQYVDHKGHLKEETMSLSGEKLRGRRPTIEKSRNKMLKRLPPPVVKLYEAETVSSLYKCAEQIVGRPRVKKSPRGEDDEPGVKFQ